MVISETQVSILPATKSDLSAVRRLFQALHEFNASHDKRFTLSDEWEHYLDEHMNREWRGTGRSMTLLAWIDDEAVGLLMMNGYVDAPLFHYRHWSEILALYVDPSIRGGDVARRMLDLGERWSREQGYDRIQLYVTATNQRAKRFYEKRGFGPVQEIWRLDLSEPQESSDSQDEQFYGSDRDPIHGKPHQIVTEFDEEDSD